MNRKHSDRTVVTVYSPRGTPDPSALGGEGLRPGAARRCRRARGIRPPGAKAQRRFVRLSARLKSCPFKTVGCVSARVKSCSFKTAGRVAPRLKRLRKNSEGKRTWQSGEAQGPKPAVILSVLSARLKPCPCYRTPSIEFLRQGVKSCPSNTCIRAFSRDFSSKQMKRGHYVQQA